MLAIEHTLSESGATIWLTTAAVLTAIAQIMLLRNQLNFPLHVPGMRELGSFKEAWGFAYPLAMRIYLLTMCLVVVFVEAEWKKVTFYCAILNTWVARGFFYIL